MVNQAWKPFALAHDHLPLRGLNSCRLRILRTFPGFGRLLIICCRRLSRLQIFDPTSSLRVNFRLFPFMRCLVFVVLVLPSKHIAVLIGYIVKHLKRLVNNSLEILRIVSVLGIVNVKLISNRESGAENISERINIIVRTVLFIKALSCRLKLSIGESEEVINGSVKDTDLVRIKAHSDDAYDAVRIDRLLVVLCRVRVRELGCSVHVSAFRPLLPRYSFEHLRKRALNKDNGIAVVVVIEVKLKLILQCTVGHVLIHTVTLNKFGVSFVLLVDTNLNVVTFGRRVTPDHGCSCFERAIIDAASCQPLVTLEVDVCHSVEDSHNVRHDPCS